MKQEQEKRNQVKSMFSFTEIPVNQNWRSLKY